jgi:hypothetical protein
MSSSKLKSKGLTSGHSHYLWVWLGRPITSGFGEPSHFGRSPRQNPQAETSPRDGISLHSTHAPPAELVAMDKSNKLSRNPLGKYQAWVNVTKVVGCTARRHYWTHQMNNYLGSTLDLEVEE